MPRLLPFAAVLLAALCFATTGTAQQLADVDASPLSVGAARILIGGGILGLIALITTVRRERPASRPARSGVPVWVLVAVGAIGVLAYQPTFFAGTRLNGVAVGTVLALGSAPIVTGVLDAVVRRRPPGRRWLVATTVALVGVVMVTGLTGGGVGAPTPGGMLASFGAGASYAVYAVASKLLLDRGWGAPQVMGAVFGTAAVFSLPVLLATSPVWLVTPAGISLALWLGVVTTAVAYLLFGWGLRVLAPATVATLTLAEPLGATLLGVFVLGERLGVIAVIGLVVLAAGLALLSIPARRREAHVVLDT
ncbi:EamA family transporter [Microbacterium sp. 1P10UB]|uniref:DMT family transporter n=1 Tax=unclassified Microbacterium TaxID=2609290 RepID=UPI0039A219B2